MKSFYPRAGVRFNPSFTDLQFAMFSRDVEEHAAKTYQMAFAAFARAADDSEGETLVWHNFGLLTQSGANLLSLYRIATEDPRINSTKVGGFVNLLFWAIIGAAEHLLCFGETDGDWDKGWRSAMDRGGILARLSADLASAGAASDFERDEMAACLSRIAAWMKKVRAYHREMIPAVPEDVEELLGLASDAGRLSATLEDAAFNLRARGALQSAAV
jgi:hypothetical protein